MGRRVLASLVVAFLALLSLWGLASARTSTSAEVRVGGGVPASVATAGSDGPIAVSATTQTTVPSSPVSVKRWPSGPRVLLAVLVVLLALGLLSRWRSSAPRRGSRGSPGGQVHLAGAPRRGPPAGSLPVLGCC